MGGGPDALDGAISRGTFGTELGEVLDHEVVDKMGEGFWLVMCSVILPNERPIWALAWLRTFIRRSLLSSPPLGLGIFVWNYWQGTALFFALRQRFFPNYTAHKVVQSVLRSCAYALVLFWQVSD